LPTPWRDGGGSTPRCEAAPERASGGWVTSRFQSCPASAGPPAGRLGLLGSMTHCAGYAAAAVAPIPRISAIGIDAEPDAPLPDGVLDLIATPAERDRLDATRPETEGPNWDGLLFSAKEAVYKAWFPLVGEWLDHQEAEICFGPQEGTFTAQLSRDGLIIDRRQIHRLHGRWVRRHGILATAVVLGRPLA
jgi:4'-phosphopantetheinyl transferase EntD